MSGSSGGTTQQTGPPPYATPAAIGLLNDTTGLLNSQGSVMPPGENYNVAPFTPYQNQGFSGIAAAGTPASGLASTSAGYLNNVLSGGQLNPTSNPYLQATYNEAAQGLVNQYQTATAPGQAAFSEISSGGGPSSTSGSANQQSVALNQYGLGQNLNNLGTNIFGGAYEQGVQNQLTANAQVGATQGALYTPGQELLAAGGEQQQQQQNVLNTATQNAQNQQLYPWQQLQRAGGIFSSLFSPSAQITTSPSGK